MTIIKTIFTIFILAILALFFFQNYAVLTSNIKLKFYSLFNISIPIYYFFAGVILLTLLIIFFLNIKHKFLINRREKKIKQLEKEIDELRKLDISEEANGK